MNLSLAYRQFGASKTLSLITAIDRTRARASKGSA